MPDLPEHSVTYQSGFAGFFLPTVLAHRDHAIVGALSALLLGL